MNHSASKYVCAYRDGLMSPDHPLFHQSSVVSSLFRRSIDMYDYIQDLHNVRDQEGFYNRDWNKIKHFQSKLSALEAAYRIELEALQSMINKLYPIQPASPITMV